LTEELKLRLVNKECRKILGSKEYEVSEQFGILHNKGLTGLYISPSIFRVMKSRRLTWAEHTGRMERQ
jgi:hypothetical protein